MKWYIIITIVLYVLSSIMPIYRLMKNNYHDKLKKSIKEHYLDKVIRCAIIQDWSIVGLSVVFIIFGWIVL